MEYYSAIKEMKYWYMPQHEWTLKNIMLNGRHQSDTKDYMIPTVWDVQIGKSMEI